MSGDCFQVAAQLILDHPNLTLVHGLPIAQAGPHAGQRYWHAWVEEVRSVTAPELREPVRLELVIDRSNGHDHTVPVVVYYRLRQIDRARVWRYTAAEAIAAMVAYETYGPWVDGWETMGG